jgi:hypothetical protein
MGSTKTKAKGVIITHNTYVNTFYAIPLDWIVYPVPQQCPRCQVAHTVKHLHLYLENNGSCIVGMGSLKHLKRAGLARLGLVVGPEVMEPPTLSISNQPGAPTREAQDNENRKIIILPDVGLDFPKGGVAHG